MTAVHFGSDTYGKVKQVGGTPIVTKFWMLSAVPIFPLESYYFVGLGRQEGIPFVYTTKAIFGLPLAQIDMSSVVIAYARGFFGALTVFGFFYFFMVYAEWTNPTRQAPDTVALAMRYFLLFCLCIGVTGGLITYLLAVQTSLREKQIRLACGEVLGICADPAFVRDDFAASVMKDISDLSWADQPVGLAAGTVPIDDHGALFRRLVVVRAQIALGSDRKSSEAETDELLRQIELVRQK